MTPGGAGAGSGFAAGSGRGLGSPAGADLTRELLSRHPAEAAPLLLGRVLSVPGEGIAARITEVEAYGGPADSPWPDPGAHTWFGPTDRNRAMFGPAGHLYLYRSYGIHTCMNVTAGPEGTGAGILLRAALLLSGHEIVEERRRLPNGGVGKHGVGEHGVGEHGVGKRDGGQRHIPAHRLTSGPGNLGRALDAGPADYGIDLLDPASRITLASGGSPAADTGGAVAGKSGETMPGVILRGPRVGLRLASAREWRFWVDDPSVTPYRRHANADGEP